MPRTSIPANADVIGAAEVGLILGIPVAGVHKGARVGDIPCWRIGRRVRFRRSVIEALTHPATEPRAA